MDFTGYQSQADSNHHICKMDTDVLSVIHNFQLLVWVKAALVVCCEPFNNSLLHSTKFIVAYTLSTVAHIVKSHHSVEAHRLLIPT